MRRGEIFGWLVVGLALLVAAVLLTWAFPASPSTQAPLCAESAQQVEQARSLVLEGLDKALVEKAASLFSVSLSVGIEGNASRGLEKTLRGFFYAQHAVGELKIPLCK